MASNGKYDFVIYGATGFTGQFVVEEVARVAEIERKKLKLEKPSLTYAVAGRNKTKLLKSIEEAKIVTGRFDSHCSVLVYLIFLLCLKYKISL